MRILRFCSGNVPQQALPFEIRLTILKIFWVIETQNKNLFAVYLLNVCTQSLRQNEKWELLNDVCANVSLKLLMIFVSSYQVYYNENLENNTKDLPSMRVIHNIYKIH